MSDTDTTVGWCEWPVESPFQSTTPGALIVHRTCGRAGSGRYLRTCWQHREAMLAEIVGNLNEEPCGVAANHLAKWITQSVPKVHDTEEQATTRAEIHKVVLLAVAEVIEYGGDYRRYLGESLEKIVSARVDARITSQWGAA